MPFVPVLWYDGETKPPGGMCMRYAKRVWHAVLRLSVRLAQDRVAEWAAQFSFYLMLALFPLLALVTTLASRIALIKLDVMPQLADILPGAAFEVVQGAMRDITVSQRPGVLPVTMIIALWAASSGVFALSKGLNMAHRMQETRKPWVVRGLCLLFTVLIVVSIFTEILMIVFGDYILERGATLLRISVPLLTLGRVLRIIVPVGVVFLTLGLMYWLIPAHRMRFRHVLPGALFATFSWMGTSWLFSIYVARFANYSRFYGSLGGVIILMIWIFLSSLTLLMGSEVNALLEHLRAGYGAEGQQADGQDQVD